MGDALPMRSIERAADLYCVGKRPVERQRPSERPAVDILHDQVIGADIIQSADVRMIQRGDGASLPLETFGELNLRDLQCDEAAEPRVACLPDFAHAAG